MCAALGACPTQEPTKGVNWRLPQRLGRDTRDMLLADAGEAVPRAPRHGARRARRCRRRPPRTAAAAPPRARHALDQPPSSAASANPAAAYSARAASLSASTCSHRLSCPHSAAARPTGCAQRATRRAAGRACPGSTEHLRSPITYVGRTQHGLALTVYGPMQLEQRHGPTPLRHAHGEPVGAASMRGRAHPGASRRAAARSRRRGAGSRARPPCWTRSSAAGWRSGRAAAAPPAWDVGFRA